MKRLCHTFIFCLLFCGALLPGQSNAPRSPGLSSIRHLGLKDGLPGRNVSSVAEGADGFLWMIVDNRIHRYDGYELLPLQQLVANPALLDQSLQKDLHLLANGDLVFTEGDRILQLDYTTNRLREILFPGKSIQLDSYEGQQIIIAEGSLNTVKKVLRLAELFPSGEVSYLDSIERSETFFPTVTYGPEGRIWLTIDQSELIRFDHNGQGYKPPVLEQFRKGWQLLDLSGGSSKEFYALTRDSLVHYQLRAPQTGRIIESGTLAANHEWVSRADQLSAMANRRELDSKFSIRNRLLLRNEKPPYWRLVHEFVTEGSPNHLFIDSAERAWMFRKQHIGLFVAADGVVTDVLSSLTEIAHFEGINSINEDQHQQLWIGTDNGVFHLPVAYRRFRRIAQRNNQYWGNTMRAFAEDKKGNLYVRCESCQRADGYNLLRIDTSTWEATPLSLHDESTGEPFQQQLGKQLLPDRDGKYHWTNTAEHLFRLDLLRGTLKKFPLPHSLIFVYDRNELIAQLADGSLVIGAKLDQLYHFDPATGFFDNLVLRNLIDPGTVRIQTLHLSVQGHLWVGTQGHGLYQIDPDQQKILARYGAGTTPALPVVSVTDLETDATGHLWVASLNNGLHRLNTITLTVDSYTMADGLPNNKIAAILPRNEDEIWVSTFNGLCRLRPSDRNCVNYFEKDGISHNEFNQTSNYLDRRGRLFFGGMNGLTVFHPDSLTNSHPDLRVMLTRLAIYDASADSLRVRYRGLDQLKELTLRPWDTWLELDLTLNDFSNPNGNRFLFQLEGLDKGWNQLNNQRTLRYDRLPAGRYTLRIRGLNDRGVSSNNEIVLPLTILQPFYQTWWFYCLVFLAFTGLVYGFFAFRNRQRMKIEAMRSRISSDLHDEVGSSLTRLSLIMQSVDVKEDEFSRQYFRKGNEVLMSAIARVRDVVWAIDARNDAVDHLKDRMEDFAFDMLRGRQIDYHFTFSGIDGKEVLTPLARQNLYLVYKEAIHNIVKHSNAKKVEVLLARERGRFHLRVIDNGTSLPGEKVVGSGLANMALRAKRVGGRIRVERVEAGFLVEMWLS